MENLNEEVCVHEGNEGFSNLREKIQSLWLETLGSVDSYQEFLEGGFQYPNDKDIEIKQLYWKAFENPEKEDVIVVESLIAMPFQTFAKEMCLDNTKKIDDLGIRGRFFSGEENEIIILPSALDDDNSVLRNFPINPMDIERTFSTLKKQIKVGGHPWILPVKEGGTEDQFVVTIVKTGFMGDFSKSILELYEERKVEDGN